MTNIRSYQGPYMDRQRIRRKIWMMMRLIILLLLVSTMTISAKSYSQKVNITATDVSVENVLRQIREQTGSSILWGNQALQNLPIISVSLKDASLEKALKTSLKDLPLSYTILGNVIYLERKQPPLSEVKLEEFSEREALQLQEITGTVKDSVTGEPLAGVTIRVQGTTTGTVTDGSGRFSLEADDDAVLEVSFVGYSSKTISVNGKSSIEILLSSSATGLDQLVVVGYGVQKKSDLTGSVSSINSDDFVQGVATDALQLISGKAPGVDISQANSEPGGKLNIQIRGAGSINSSNSALIVIDGVPGGSTANLNPADIESIEILKDASSAAIYGTRAANGVVLITTKKGHSGQTDISYSTYLALQSPASRLDVLDATSYMNYLNDLSIDLGQNPPFTTDQVANAGKGTNWQNLLFRNSLANNHQLSISGGSDNVKYYTSLRYLNQEGILINSGIKQYNVLANIEVTPSTKFKFGININGNLNYKDKIADESQTGNENADPLNAATQFDPNLSPNRDENGKYEINPTIALDNPIALAYGYDYKDQNNRFYGNAYGEYKILPELKATLRLGGDLYNIRNNHYTSQITQRGAANGGIGEIESSEQSYWLSEGLIDYNKQFGNHNVSLMGGATWEKFLTLNQNSYATGFLSDVTETNLLQSGDASTAKVSSARTSHKLQSFFGRLNYTYNDKYLFTATLRRDGTSRFSKENKYAIFPSVALGWKINEEPFMSGSSALNDLKLRLSYGKMGNEGIGNFETISTYIAGGNTVFGDKIVNGAQPARLPNPDLKWETTSEYDVGVDYGFLGNRISGSIDYYIKITQDQLFEKPIPMTTGFSTILTNFGKVRNSGFEFSVTTKNLVGKFKWNTTLNFATLKNKVTELPPFIGQIITGGIIANIPGFSIVQQGSPMYAYYGYKITGIFNSQEQIAGSSQPDAQPGWPIFEDSNGDGKIDAADRVILGNPYPSLTYSFGNVFSYKNFSLSMYWLGVHGIKTFNGNIVESIFPINFDRNVISRYYFDRWTENNTNAKYPSGVNSGTYFGNGKMINSYSIQDASYLRLKSVSFNYNVPLNNLNTIKSLGVTLTGENLLTITRFIGYDPAANQTGDGTNVAKSSYNNYPIARIFTLGVNVTF